MQQLYLELRKYFPFAEEDHFLAQIDPRAAQVFLEARELEAREAPRAAQAYAEIWQTVKRLFPELQNPDDLMRWTTQHATAPQGAATARLALLGVGGEGAVFKDSAGKLGVYKFHPGDIRATAFGITQIRPSGSADAEITMERVSLVHTIQRYLLQTMLAGAAETQVAGITASGYLITRQPHLQELEHETAPAEITQLMRELGGSPVRIVGPHREAKNSWALPDGVGNWLLAIDLKPLNVLRDPAGFLRITDAIVAPLTPSILAANPALAERFPATAPELQLSIP